MTKFKIDSQSGLYYFDINDIRSWKPCYDPKKHLSENWKGTALTILSNDSISIPDRFWVVLRPQLVSEKLMRLFAVSCARQVQDVMKNPTAIKALDVAEAYANGSASVEELRQACHSAGLAAKTYADYLATRCATMPDSISVAWEDRIYESQLEKLIEMVLSEGKERTEIRNYE